MTEDWIYIYQGDKIVIYLYIPQKCYRTNCTSLPKMKIIFGAISEYFLFHTQPQRPVRYCSQEGVGCSQTNSLVITEEASSQSTMRHDRSDLLEVEYGLICVGRPERAEQKSK